MAEKIVQIVTREFMKLVEAHELEVGDILKKTISSKGELVIDTVDGIKTLKVGMEDEKIIPIQTCYTPIKKLGEKGIFSYLDLNISLSGLYIKLTENKLNMNVAEYFKGNVCVSKSRLEEVGFKL